MIFRFKYASYVISVRCGSESISGPHYFLLMRVRSEVAGKGF